MWDVRYAEGEGGRGLGDGREREREHGWRTARDRPREGGGDKGGLDRGATNGVLGVLSTTTCDRCPSRD